MFRSMLKRGRLTSLLYPINCENEKGRNQKTTIKPYFKANVPVDLSFLILDMPACMTDGLTH